MIQIATIAVEILLLKCKNKSKIRIWNFLISHLDKLRDWRCMWRELRCYCCCCCYFSLTNNSPWFKRVAGLIFNFGLATTYFYAFTKCFADCRSLLIYTHEKLNGKYILLYLSDFDSIARAALDYTNNSIIVCVSSENYRFWGFDFCLRMRREW